MGERIHRRVAGFAVVAVAIVLATCRGNPPPSAVVRVANIHDGVVLAPVHRIDGWSSTEWGSEFAGTSSIMVPNGDYGAAAVAWVESAFGPRAGRLTSTSVGESGHGDVRATAVCVTQVVDGIPLRETGTVHIWAGSVVAASLRLYEFRPRAGTGKACIGLEVARTAARALVVRMQGETAPALATLDSIPGVLMYSSAGVDLQRMLDGEPGTCVVNPVWAFGNTGNLLVDAYMGVAFWIH